MEKRATGIYKPDGSRADIEIPDDLKGSPGGCRASGVVNQAGDYVRVSVDSSVGVFPNSLKVRFQLFDSLKSVLNLLPKFFSVVHRKFFRHNSYCVTSRNAIRQVAFARRFPVLME